MKLCLCGCREVRHEDLGKGQRGACLRCGCEAFKDAKSSIEEEIGPPPAEVHPEPLESFSAWRCSICGGRSWRQTACCRGQRMEPVRVEIHAREVA